MNTTLLESRDFYFLYENTLIHRFFFINANNLFVALRPFATKIAGEGNFSFVRVVSKAEAQELGYPVFTYVK